MKLSFADLVYKGLIDLPYDTPLVPREENREVTMQLVRQFQSDELDVKYGFIIECSGNVIKKYPRLTQEKWEEWNTIYFSPDRITSRSEANRKIKRLTV